MVGKYVLVGHPMRSTSWATAPAERPTSAPTASAVTCRATNVALMPSSPGCVRRLVRHRSTGPAALDPSLGERVVAGAGRIDLRGDCRYGRRYGALGEGNGIPREPRWTGPRDP